MRIAVILLRWVMNFIYFFMKLAPTRNNRIVFLSRQADTPSEDFICLRERILELRPDAEILMITQRADSNAKSMLRFAGATLKSMRYLATSRVCILDAYWPAVSVLNHKDELAVIQLWHAMGKIKKSGYQSIGKKFGRSDMIAKEMRMHRNYDVIIAGGRAFNPFYCASFGVEEEKLYNVGLPRMDVLRENVEKSRVRFYKMYPWLRGKKIVLYVPTFRKGQILDPKELVENGIADISVGNNYTVACDKQGKVYVWGDTKLGTTGIDIADIPADVQNANIVMVAAGYDHIIAVDDKGIVHGFGMTHGCFGKFYEELGKWLRK